MANATDHATPLHPATENGTASAHSPKSSTSQHKSRSSLDMHRQNNNSSKLPTFRFADLTQRTSLPQPTLLKHEGHLQAPNSFDSLDAARLCPKPTEGPLPSQPSVAPNHPGRDDNNDVRDRQTSSPTSKSMRQQSATSRSNSSRSRASTYATACSTIIAQPSLATKRPLSHPESLSIAPKATDAVVDLSTIPAQRESPQQSAGRNPSTTLVVNTRMTAQRPTRNGADSTTRDATGQWAQDQAALAFSRENTSAVLDASQDVKKAVSRPPSSYRPPPISNHSGRTIIPPIRSFRSSGSRRSLTAPDMNHLGPNDYFDAEESDKSSGRDNTLRARNGDQLVGTTGNTNGADTEDDGAASVDVFMKIAQEDTSSVVQSDILGGGNAGFNNRATRLSRRRPLSMAVNSYTPTSPPPISRRLSDQHETSGNQRPTERSLYARREVIAQDDTLDTRSSIGEGARVRGPPPPSMRPLILGTRDASQQETPTEFTYRRRPSLHDTARTPALRNSYGFSKAYASSPLGPRSAELQYGAAHGAGDGTESTLSTTAPSTVWDELEDIKSRIHRLEATGHLPSDDRPATAATNATTMSGSPKRSTDHSSGQGMLSPKANGQPILLTALARSKPAMNGEAYEAIEAAASEVLGLSQLLGAAGQPGPISSGASALTTGGPSTVTDRQLRKKVDSICRSLTEFCLAMSDVSNRPSTRQSRDGPLPSPERRPAYLAGSGLRRGSLADQPLPSIENSSGSPPNSAVNRTSSLMMPSTRYASTYNAPEQSLAIKRHISLAAPRVQRAVTEEPSESGRQSSLLRTRRGTTEEPENGRSAVSFSYRPQNGVGDEPQSRLRAPSRAFTEVGTLRASTGNTATYDRYNQEQAGMNSSVLPRRRPVGAPSSTRFSTPSTNTSPLSGQQDVVGAYAEQSAGTPTQLLQQQQQLQRQYSTQQKAGLGRASSLIRRRESGIPSVPSVASRAGGY